MPELYDKTLLEMRDALASGSVTAEDAVAACLKRIEATEPALHALMAVRGEEALAEARALDAAGPNPDKPLWGVPVTVKDVLCTKGTATTCGSKILEGFTPFYDATAVARLRDAGAVIADHDACAALPR